MRRFQMRKLWLRKRCRNAWFWLLRRLRLRPMVHIAVNGDGYALIVVDGRVLYPERWGHFFLLNDPCVYYRGARETVDHITPMSNGGRYYAWGNHAPACKPCNRAKAAKPLLHYLVERRRAELSWKRKNPPRKSRAVKQAQRRAIREWRTPERLMLRATMAECLVAKGGNRP